MYSSDLRCLYGAELLKRLPPHDVINMHWISCWVDVDSFVSAIPKDVPVFWKLDDMNPFTGGCHFDHDCGKYMTGCGACPQLGSKKSDDLSSQVWRRKKAYFGKFSPDRLHLIALNHWMARNVSNSPLLGKFKLTIIPNGLDTEVFAPRDKAEARATLGIPQDARVIFFAAESIGNKRKGFDLLVEAIAGISNVDKMYLLSVGNMESPIELNIPHLNLGYIYDEHRMSLAYSAADIYATAAIHDNQPNTILEAMACGTPVVGFAVGGIPEIVKPGVTGLLAKGGDVQGLREAIAELLQHNSKRESMGHECRKTVLQEFSLELQCKRYTELYETALKSRSAIRPN
jgi:glycosyltransferase involved in cell wall biosynthesis